MLLLLKCQHLIEQSDLEKLTAVFPELKCHVMKLILKGEGGGGA